MAENKKVLIFGTFDGLHPGHIFFLNEAKKLGQLFVSVASDKNVLQLKKRQPLKNERERLEEVKKELIVSEAFVGEEIMGSFKAIKKIKPDIVALGYDQRELKTALLPLSKELNFKIKILKSFKPRVFHSHIINKIKEKLKL